MSWPAGAPIRSTNRHPRGTSGYTGAPGAPAPSAPGAPAPSAPESAPSAPESAPALVSGALVPVLVARTRYWARLVTSRV